MHLNQRFYNRNQNIDDVVQLKNPNKADLSPSPENIVKRNLTLLARMIKLLVG
jgi:hypothetical protein